MKLLPGIALAIFLIALGLFIHSDVAVAAVHDAAIVQFSTPPAALMMTNGADTDRQFLLRIQNQSDHTDPDNIRVRVQATAPANCTVNGNAGTSIVFDTVETLGRNMFKIFTPSELTLTFNCSVVTDGAVFAVKVDLDHDADDPLQLDDDDNDPTNNSITRTLVVRV